MKKLSFDSGPLIAVYKILVHNVLLLPGGPTKMFGTLLRREMNRISKFSLRVDVKAIVLNSSRSSIRFLKTSVYKLINSNNDVSYFFLEILV